MIDWYSNGCFPGNHAFTMSPKDYVKTIKKLNFDPGDCPCFRNDSSGAECLYLHNDKIGLNFIVTLSRKATFGKTYMQIAAMLAHEAVHIVDFLLEHIGEKSPGMETRAYLTQYIVQNLLYSYDEQRKAKK